MIAQQEEILKSIKQEAKALDKESLAAENEKLSAALESEIEKNKALADSEASLKKELDYTKSALFNKMADEKLAAFSRVQKRIDAAYYNANDATANKLYTYELNCISSINATQKAIENYGADEYKDISKKLYELRRELDEKHRKIEEYRRTQINAAQQHNNQIGAVLRDEPLTEIEKRSADGSKSLESFVGLNLLSKLGILLLLVGIVMLGRFAYTHMSDVLKGVLIYLLGGVLIGAGELFHKKEKTVFSNALISGGVSVLYAATATCYFAFNLFDARITFIACIIVTAFSIFISNQIKSWIVCAFATVGGYLPLVAAFMISYGKAASDITFLPAASVYFILLSVVVLILTRNKKWYASQYIGYAFQIAAVGGVARCAWAVKDLPGYGYALPLAAGFAAASYIVYLMMPASKIIKKTELDVFDTVLLGINTLSGATSCAVTLFNCFADAQNGNRAVGFCFVLFAVIYALLSTAATRREGKGASPASAILYTSVLIFSMLVVPFLFGWKYAGAAWVIEGAALAIISIKKRLIIPEIAGLVCMVLSLFPFYFSGAEYYNGSPYSALAIITYCIMIVCFWAYTVTGLSSARERLEYYAVFEIISSAATFAYLVYLWKAFCASPRIIYFSDFTDTCVYAVFILIIALALRDGILKNKISIVLSDIVGICLPLYTVVAIDIVYKYSDITNYLGENVKIKWFAIINLILLFVINISVALFFSNTLSRVIKETEAPVWIYTAAISVLALAAITGILMAQFGVKFSSVIISGIYILVACLLIFIGFKKRFSVVRSGGLVLILAAFAKLCFADTRGLDSAWKIASYFAFGGILILISFFYQRFTKQLEAKSNGQ